MSVSLARNLEPSHEHMWKAVSELLVQLEQAVDRDTFVNECLDRLVDLLDVDRGVLFLRGKDGEHDVVGARGPRGELSDRERDEISNSMVAQALEHGKPVVVDSDALPTSHSVTAFGIWMAMAVPLHSGGSQEALGVLYVDLRKRSKFMGPRHREFIRSAAVLTSVVVSLSRALSDTLERLDQARARHTEARQLPSLSQLLRFDSLAELREELSIALKSDLPILITGESGCGKTLVARAFAEACENRPIVRAVLGFSDDLNTISSELFGHMRGAFSGAVGKREGLVEYADGGVLILDEILNLPVQAQQLLLDFTQFGTYRPLGYSRATPKHAKVRLIAATNGNLQQAIAEKRFREDLYYRLAAIHIRLPPLRERRQDIAALAEGVLSTLDGPKRWTLSDELRAQLASPQLRWPGNIRQLERVILRARDRIRAREPGNNLIELHHLDLRDVGQTSHSTTPPDAASNSSVADRWQVLAQRQSDLEADEESLIREALVANGGVIARAARALGVARTTLSSRVQALGLQGVGRS